MNILKGENTLIQYDWRGGESTRFPLKGPRFDSSTWRHM